MWVGHLFSVSEVMKGGEKRPTLELLTGTLWTEFYQDFGQLCFFSFLPLKISLRPINCAAGWKT